MLELISCGLLSEAFFLWVVVDTITSIKTLIICNFKFNFKGMRNNKNLDLTKGRETTESVNFLHDLFWEDEIIVDSKNWY